jgi:hypothetical protein
MVRIDIQGTGLRRDVLQEIGTGKIIILGIIIFDTLPELYDCISDIK